MMILDARDFGAKGDGKTDDTAALQSALDALVAGDGVHSRLVIPVGTYVVTSELIVAGKYNFEVEGVGAQLWWQGTDATKAVLRITSCEHYRVSGIAFKADAKDIGGTWTATRAKYALCIDAGGGGSGRGVLERINVQGYPLGIPGVPGRNFDYGIAFVASIADANNDHFTMRDCVVENCAEACILIGHTQSKAHKFFGCLLNFAPFGVLSVGSFCWYGGTIGSSSVACFRIGTPVNCDPVLISGVNCEGSARFLTTLDPLTTTAYSAEQPLTIEGVRFATEALAVDGTDADGVAFGAVIDFRWSGPLVLVGNRFGPVTTEGNGRRAKVRISTLQWSALAVTAIGNTFVTDPNGVRNNVSPIVLGAKTAPTALRGLAAAGSIVLLGNNYAVRALASDTPLDPAKYGPNTGEQPCPDMWQSAKGTAYIHDATAIGGVGMYGAAPPASRPVVSGSWADGTAGKSMLTALASLGIVTDATT